MAEEQHSPLTWEVSAVENCGDYGVGPDVSSGFTSYAIVDKEGCTIVDTLNSGVAIVHEEVDEDGLSAWDEQGRVNAAFIVRAVNNHEALIDALREAKDLIKIWHGDVAWDVYDALSPEMIRINRALALAEKGSEL